jgi:LPS sulfotransferase NodH
MVTMTYKPFVIAGMPRTGSNLLATTVGQHPAILAYAELFHPIVSERAGTHAIRRDGAALYFDEESADPVDFLRRWVWSAENGSYRAVGFKIFVEYVRARSTHRLLERLRDEVAGLRVLHIRRANYLDVYVSRLVANKTERWISYPEDGSPTHETGDIRLVISPDAATRFFQAMEQADACIEGLFEGTRYLNVDYEHLSRSIQEQANVVFTFLGVESRTVVPAIQRQVTARKEDLVLNYEELRRHFAGSAYEAFFAADRDSSPVAPSAPASGVRQCHTHACGDSQPPSLESLDERLLGAINDGLLGLQGPPSGPQPCTFLPAEPENLRTLPRLRTAARGNLERINGVAAYENLTLRRSAPIFFAGW